MSSLVLYECDAPNDREYGIGVSGTDNTDGNFVLITKIPRIPKY